MSIYIVIYCIACPIGWRFSFRRDVYIYFFLEIFVLSRALRRVNYDVIYNIEINLNKVTRRCNKMDTFEFVCTATAVV